MRLGLLANGRTVDWPHLPPEGADLQEIIDQLNPAQRAAVLEALYVRAPTLDQTQ